MPASDEERIEKFVQLGLLADSLEFDPEAPVVSQVFLASSIQAYAMELEADGLLEDAADRLKDAVSKVHKTGDYREPDNPGDSEGG